MNRFSQSSIYRLFSSPIAWMVVLPLYHAIGVVGLLFPITRPLMQSVVGLSITTTFVLLMCFHRPWSAAMVGHAFVIGVFGFLLEWIGVSTGVIFGSYQYGPALGPSFGNTPFLIGINWFMLSYVSYLLTQSVSSSAYIRPLIGASLMISYDLWLEPIAPVMRMWDWEGGVVPLQNYLAWFAIGYIMVLSFHWVGKRYQNPLAITVFATQVLFFIVLNFLHVFFGLE